MQKVLTCRSNFTWLLIRIQCSSFSLHKRWKHHRIICDRRRKMSGSWIWDIESFYYWDTKTTWYYVNSRRNVDSKNASPRWDLIPRPYVINSDALTTELLESLWWARVKLWVSIGATSSGYTATYLAHMNSLTASRCHNKAYQDASKQLS